MPNTPREKLLGFLQTFHTISRIYGQSFYALNSQAVIYFRYSRRHGAGQYFFGVEVDDLGRYASANTFLLFICGDDTRVFALPTQTFYQMVQGTEPISGQWKIFIEERDDRWLLRVARVGRFDISAFRNNFDFTPPQLRAAPPVLGQFIPVRSEAALAPDPPPLPEAPQDIAVLLLDSAIDSRNYYRFEDVVAQAFSELGLEAHREGGVGNTDVLITRPFRAIVDCKSTSSASLSNANFVRIKRHMAQHDAVAASVVSIRFDPGVQEDAKTMGVALIEAASLAELVRQSWVFPPAADSLSDLLSYPGLVPPDRWLALTKTVTAQQQFIARMSAILDVLDFSERSVDELRGRLGGSGQADYTRDQIMDGLAFFSSNVLGIVSPGTDGYRLNLAPEQARTRIKTVLTGLAGSPALPTTASR